MRLYSDPGNAPTTLIASSYPKIRRVNFTHLYQKLQIFSKYFTLTERNRPKKDPSLERNDLRSNFFVERERERWSEIQLGKADYHGWRGCRYVWVDDSGSVTRHHSISSPVRRVEASPLPCLASEGGSSGFSVAVKGMADTRRYFADFPGKLCRREAEFPHPRNTLIEPRLSNGRIEWFGHESHSVSYTGESRNAFLEQIFQNIVSQDRFLFNLAKLNI